ncbi:MAG TPA: putative glycolipid-binding domain-containing protein [Acidimicrobiia bacterium]|nr:putative glycolipid-binding domain-containing protein [Acidimicrobiia bacterium]
MGVATYVWRRLDLEGSVFVRMDEGVGGVAAEGYEICSGREARWATHFRVSLDAEWRHRQSTVAVIDAAGVRTLDLASADGAWRRDGRHDPALDGCTDLDLAGNPFTNAFVTRRVAPEVGAEVAVVAAYVETPTLSVRPLVQRYRRTAADRWVYADDLYGTFEFGTDAAGVAVDYQGLAERRESRRSS